MTKFSKSFAVFALIAAAGLSGCATTDEFGNKVEGLEFQISKNEPVSIAWKNEKLHFCPVAKLIDGECTVRGVDMSGRIWTGWLDAQRYVESIIRAPLNLPPTVSYDPENRKAGITLRFTPRFHAIPYRMHFPLS